MDGTVWIDMGEHSISIWLYTGCEHNDFEVLHNLHSRGWTGAELMQ